MGLPEKLKAAREARGWSIEEVGNQLKLPARVVSRVEAGDFDALGAPIYRRGYLRSFARLVDIPADQVEISLQEGHESEPALIATGVRPRGEYMFEQFLRPATYIALTALIALPVVWWAASGRLGQELAGNGRFDLQPPPLQQAEVSTLADAGRSRPPLLPLADHPPQTEIVRASMMSMPQQLDPTVVRADPGSTPNRQEADTAASPMADQVLADSDTIGSGGNEAILNLADDSWVEVEANGRRIQQALLTPGQWRFRSEGTLSFKIGNSSNATLTAAGEMVDLAAHRSQNGVARIELFGNSNDG
jgi:cytoskeleton protein RodZ